MQRYTVNPPLVKRPSVPYNVRSHVAASQMPPVGMHHSGGYRGHPQVGPMPNFAPSAQYDPYSYPAAAAAEDDEDNDDDAEAESHGRSAKFDVDGDDIMSDGAEPPNSTQSTKPKIYPQGNGDKMKDNFPMKLYRVLNDPRFQDVCRWSPDGTGFRITDQEGFIQTAMQAICQTQNFDTFVRQLNMYGFKKIGRAPRAAKGSEPAKLPLTFKHSEGRFVRYREELVASIERKHPGGGAAVDPGGLDDVDHPPQPIPDPYSPPAGPTQDTFLQQLQATIHAMHQESASLRRELEAVKGVVTNLQQDLSGVKTELQSTKQKCQDLQTASDEEKRSRAMPAQTWTNGASASNGNQHQDPGFLAQLMSGFPPQQPGAFNSYGTAFASTDPITLPTLPQHSNHYSSACATTPHANAGYSDHSSSSSSHSTYTGGSSVQDLMAQASAPQTRHSGTAVQRTPSFANGYTVDPSLLHNPAQNASQQQNTGRPSASSNFSFESQQPTPNLTPRNNGVATVPAPGPGSQAQHGASIVKSGTPSNSLFRIWGR